MDHAPFGSPTAEFMKRKGFDSPRDVETMQGLISGPSTHDLLLAILASADSLWHELRSIRTALESQQGPRPTPPE